MKMAPSRIAPQFSKREPPLTVIMVNGKMIETKEHGVLFDATAGYWYNILGSNPELNDIKSRFTEQQAYHLYDEKTNPWAEDLSDRLCASTGKEAVIYGCTGSMACENARKEAVKYHRANGRSEEELVFGAIEGGYHGSVGEMLKIIDKNKNPLVISEPIYKSYTDIGKIVRDFEERVGKLESRGKKVAGLFYEPIMGTRGAVFLPKEYLEGIAQFCREKDILLIGDMVTTGFGRTGVMFGYEHTGIMPDIICLGKGMAAGYSPLSATLLDRKIVDAWHKLEEEGEPYSKLHRRGNSLAGTPEGTALALKVLEILERDKIIEDVAKKGEYALERLKQLERLDNVREVRGKGLMIAVDVRDSELAHKAKRMMWERGINFIPEGRMVMFMPAYTITEEEIDDFALNLEEVLKAAK